MTIFADLDENNIVINVVVADQEFINSLPNSTEYMVLTRGGIGWTYDAAADVFIAPQPYPSWALDSNYDWQPPVPQPPAPPYTYWDEDTQTWQPYAHP
jgi:hypothetical protein